MNIAQSPHSVAETVDRLIASLRHRDIKVFARIDHAGGAHDVGLELPAEEVLVFGDPQVGTALMEVNPQVGLELPLRILVWSENGTTHVGYRSPEELADAYDVAARASVLAAMANLLAQLVAEAAT